MTQKQPSPVGAVGKEGKSSAVEAMERITEEIQALLTKVGAKELRRSASIIAGLSVFWICTYQTHQDLKPAAEIVSQLQAGGRLKKRMAEWLVEDNDCWLVRRHRQTLIEVLISDDKKLSKFAAKQMLKQMCRRADDVIEVTVIGRVFLLVLTLLRLWSLWDATKGFEKNVCQRNDNEQKLKECSCQLNDLIVKLSQLTTRKEDAEKNKLRVELTNKFKDLQKKSVDAALNLSVLKQYFVIRSVEVKVKHEQRKSEITQWFYSFIFCVAVTWIFREDYGMFPKLMVLSTAVAIAGLAVYRLNTRQMKTLSARFEDYCCNLNDIARSKTEWKELLEEMSSFQLKIRGAFRCNTLTAADHSLGVDIEVLKETISAMSKIDAELSKKYRIDEDDAYKKKELFEKMEAMLSGQQESDESEGLLSYSWITNRISK